MSTLNDRIDQDQAAENLQSDLGPKLSDMHFYISPHEIPFRLQYVHFHQ